MTTQDLLDDRYGRRRSPARRWLLVVGTLVVVAAIGYFGWSIVQGTLDAYARVAGGMKPRPA